MVSARNWGSIYLSEIGEECESRNINWNEQSNDSNEINMKNTYKKNVQNIIIGHLNHYMVKHDLRVTSWELTA